MPTSRACHPRACGAIITVAERAPLRLVQFTREPVPGSVKTRMQPAMTSTAACALHCELTLWTLSTLCAYPSGRVELSVAGNRDHPFFAQCRALGDIAVTAQEEGDLGARMYNALAAGLERACKVILVGSDCPALDEAYLTAAETALDTRDVVLGPALDGGYVLIGVRSVRREWFDNIAWGTGTVFDATVAALGRSGTGFAALPPLADIDRPADLELWRSIRAGESRVRREPQGSGAERG